MSKRFSLLFVTPNWPLYRQGLRFRLMVLLPECFLMSDWSKPMSERAKGAVCLQADGNNGDLLPAVHDGCPVLSPFAAVGFGNESHRAGEASVSNKKIKMSEREKRQRNVLAPFLRSGCMLVIGGLLISFFLLRRFLYSLSP